MRKLKRNRKTIRSNTRIVTREEETKIVTLLRGTGHKDYHSDVADLIEFQIDTGMRMLETLELRYKDVDFMNNIIIVQTTMGDRNRRIPMTKRVVAILKRRQEYDQQKPFNIKENQISRVWHWVKEQIGLKDDKYLVLYALRKTCVYRLVIAGVDMEIIQDWFGYSRNPGSRRFAPLALHHLTKAVELLENS